MRETVIPSNYKKSHPDCVNDDNCTLSSYGWQSIALPGIRYYDVTNFTSTARDETYIIELAYTIETYNQSVVQVSERGGVQEPLRCQANDNTDPLISHARQDLTLRER